MNSFHNIFPSLDEAKTTVDMRAAIDHARLMNGLIHASMRYADCEGMSDADRYVFLAYHALQQLAASNRQVFELASRMPPAPITVPASMIVSTFPEGE